MARAENPPAAPRSYKNSCAAATTAWNSFSCAWHTRHGQKITVGRKNGQILLRFCSLFLSIFLQQVLPNLVPCIATVTIRRVKSPSLIELSRTAIPPVSPRRKSFSPRERSLSLSTLKSLSYTLSKVSAQPPPYWS